MRQPIPHDAGSPPDQKLFQSLKRTQTVIAAAYGYDSAILFGFALFGFIPLWVPLVAGSLLALLVVGVGCVYRFAWSAKFADPTIFLPQQLYAIAVALGVAFAAPQIGFQCLATLFSISTFSFMAPNQSGLIWSWIAATAGTVGLIFLEGARLAIPTATLSGQVLTSLVVVGILARCIWVALFVRKLQLRIRRKNRELQSAVERIESLANTDELTGLPNRRWILKWLDEQIAVAQAERADLCVAILDIDHFKRINDIYGHLAGDRTLQIVAKAIGSVTEATDRLGRYGGEEFLVVLRGIDLAEARAPLERIREQMAAIDWAPIDAALRITLTIGATQYIPGEATTSLMQRADLALYLGKESGRDQVVLDKTPLDAVAGCA